jgi:hypothetical protein
MRSPSAARFRRRTLDWPAYGVLVFTVAALGASLLAVAAAGGGALGWGDALATTVTAVVAWCFLCLPPAWLSGRRKRGPKLATCGYRGPGGSRCSIPVRAGQDDKPVDRRHPGAQHFDPATGCAW